MKYSKRIERINNIIGMVNQKRGFTLVPENAVTESIRDMKEVYFQDLADIPKDKFCFISPKEPKGYRVEI